MINRPTSTRRSFLTVAGTTAALAAVGSSRLLANPPDLTDQEGTKFAPPIGVCTSLKNASTLRDAGAAYLEAGVRWLLVPDQPEAEFEKNLAKAKSCGIPVTAANGFLPGSLKSVGPEANHAGVMVFAKKAFERAEKVGIKTIVFGSGGSRAVPEGFDHRVAELQFVALLAKMAEPAKAHSVTVVVEPLNKGEVNFINTVPEGARLVEAVDHPNIRLLADIFHMLRMDEPAQHILDAGPLLHHVHIAEKEARTSPGVKGDDFRPYLAALAKVGYRGGISIECGWKELATELPIAVRTLREQM